MKKYLFFAVALPFLFVSCSKNNPDTPSAAKGRPMTINASIAQSPDSKISFTEDSGLKGSWDATEKMTVVSLDVEGNALAYDLFTSTGEAGRTTAEFTGTITSEDAVSYYCYYPAMEECTELDNAYESKRVPFQGNEDLQPILYIEDESVNSTYIDYQNKYINQTGDASISHIKDRIVMSGEATIDGNVANVEFSHLLTVFKINLTFPNELIGQAVGKIDIYDYNSPFTSEGWGYIDGYAFACGGEEYTSELYLGGWNDTEPNGITIPEGGELTVYIPTIITKAMEASSSWTVRTYDTSLDPISDDSLTWNEEKTLDPGKMYTFDVSVQFRN